MAIPLFYLALVLAALAAAVIAGHRYAAIYALLMLADWAATNAAVGLLGYEGAPLLVPVCDALVAMGVALVALRERGGLGVWVFGLYILVGAVHVWGFVTHQQRYSYFLALNLIFAVQCVIIGGAGVARGVADRVRIRYRRALDAAWSGASAFDDPRRATTPLRKR